MELPDTYSSLIAGYPAMFVTITPENREVVLEAPREIYLGIENIVDFPMYGAAGADGKVNFVCPFGLICFPVTGDNISVKTIYIDTTTPQKEITGRFQVDENTYETTFLNSSHGSEFQIVWTGTVQLTDVPSVFYAVLPAGEYGAGTEFRFTRADGSVITKRTRQPFTVTRARYSTCQHWMSGIEPAGMPVPGRVHRAAVMEAGRMIHPPPLCRTENIPDKRSFRREDGLLVFRIVRLSFRPEEPVEKVQYRAGTVGGVRNFRRCGAVRRVRSACRLNWFSMRYCRLSGKERK